MLDDIDFDPTAADLDEVEQDDLLLVDVSDDDYEDEPFADDGPVDDRWSGSGIPAWSAWA
jgi:hypothetical protein